MCSTADTHLKLLDRVVSCASLLTGGLFESDIAHRRSAAVLCMLYTIRCNPMQPLYGVLPVPYVPVRVTRGALVAHRHTYTPSHCRTSQCYRTFILLSVTQWKDLPEPIYSMVSHWRVSRAVPMLFYWHKLSIPFCLLFFPFSPFCLLGWYCGAGVFGLIGCKSLSPFLSLPTSFALHC